MKPVRLSEIAARYQLDLRGENLEIRMMGLLSHRSRYRSQQLTFAVTPDYIQSFSAGDVGACVVDVRNLKFVPSHRSVLVGDGDPEENFYNIFADSVAGNFWPKLETSMGQDNSIASSTAIHDHVQIGDNCVIMDNVVILPNTHIGNNVVIKPNSVIGGDGWEARIIHKRRRVPPHAGGVWIENYVQIGSNCCIDRGLFGDFTYIGQETLLDNLIYVAHSCTLGERCKITACVEISGNVVLGHNVWLGPNTSVINHVSIGDHSFLGIGSNVLTNVPRHALAYGNPAKVRGWVCLCRQKLEFEAGRTTCVRCETEYALDGGNVSRAEEETSPVIKL